MTVVLDTWPVMRYIDDAPPVAQDVEDLLDVERPVMSWINLGEVFYVTCRAQGEDHATDVVRRVRSAVDAELPDERLVLAAARIKADYAMSYADAFAAATAMRHDATLWTGDPELLVDGSPWRWKDLRS